MKPFAILSDLVRPQRAEFIKRLEARRLAKSDSFFSGNATKGSAAYFLRVYGLSSLDYAASPAATIVEILEFYREPAFFNHYKACIAYSRSEQETNFSTIVMKIESMGRIKSISLGLGKSIETDYDGLENALKLHHVPALDAGMLGLLLFDFDTVIGPGFAVTDNKRIMAARSRILPSEKLR